MFIITIMVTFTAVIQVTGNQTCPKVTVTCDLVALLTKYYCCSVAVGTSCDMIPHQAVICSSGYADFLPMPYGDPDKRCIQLCR